MSITCPQCQKAVPEGTRFCPLCRTPVVAVTADGGRTEVVPNPQPGGVEARRTRSPTGSRERLPAVSAPRPAPRAPPPEGPTEDRSMDRSLEQDRPELPASSVGLAAAELWLALREARRAFRELGGADQGTLYAALGLILANFLPFVGVPGDPWRPGLLAGGWVLVGLAVWSLWLVGARSQALGAAEDPGDLPETDAAELRRLSLLHILCGSLATAYTGYLFLLYGKLTQVRTVTGESMTPLLRPGLGVALFFATGLAYAGLARFRADAARRRHALED